MRPRKRNPQINLAIPPEMVTGLDFLVKEWGALNRTEVARRLLAVAIKDALEEFGADIGDHKDPK